VITSEFDAVVISDYNKGYLTYNKLFEIVESSNVPIFIDSKKTELPNKSNCFIKINELENENLIGDYDNIIITKGGEGCVYKNTLYPASKVNVYDVVGAGDTFLSGLVYGYLKYNDMEKSIRIANKAASISVQHPGTYVLKEKDVDLLRRY
jgi:D-beta-D-heptose 7-phosphate kinase/D-beta-D-heptose 1-phosphate adenosyltransferase